MTDSFFLPYKYYYIGLYIERDTSILYVTNLDNYSKLVLAFYFQHQNDMQLHLNTLSSTSPRYCTRYPPSNSSLSFVSRLMWIRNAVHTNSTNVLMRRHHWYLVDRTVMAQKPRSRRYTRPSHINRSMNECQSYLAPPSAHGVGVEWWYSGRHRVCCSYA